MSLVGIADDVDGFFDRVDDGGTGPPFFRERCQPAASKAEEGHNPLLLFHDTGRRGHWVISDSAARDEGLAGGRGVTAAICWTLNLAAAGVLPCDDVFQPDSAAGTHTWEFYQEDDDEEGEWVALDEARVVPAIGAGGDKVEAISPPTETGGGASATDSAIGGGSGGFHAAVERRHLRAILALQRSEGSSGSLGSSNRSLRSSLGRQKSGGRGGAGGTTILL